MPRQHRDYPPMLGAPLENGSTISRLSSAPDVPSQDSRQPSELTIATLEHNRQHINQIARYSAMQAMPILMARGEQTDLQQQSRLLKASIEELIRRAIDDGDGHVQDSVGIYSVEVMVAEQLGADFSDKRRNRFVLEVDVTVPLEYTYLHFPPQHYTKGKRLADQWFKE